MMGYVQQFHDEGGDPVDRTVATDLSRKTDAELARTLAARIVGLVVSGALAVIGSIGAATLPWDSWLVIPSLIAVFAGVLHLALTSGGLWRVGRELRERRWAREVRTSSKPEVHPGVARSRA